jgi:hypothetical protein
MTELEHTARLPERHGGGPPSFMRLAGRLTALTAAAFSLREGLHLLQRRMDADATDVDQLAEECAAAEVEPRFTALMHEAGHALRAVADASRQVAGAADSVAAGASGLHDAHQTEYGGVYEAVNRRPDVRQARPGFYENR